jgi:hypothetical protein
MRRFVFFAVFFASIMAAACGDDGDKAAETASPRATESAQSAPSTSAAGTATTSPRATTAPAAATPVALEPSIEDALSCRVPAANPRAPVSTGQLQTIALDVKAFPFAACNDGTPGLMSFRPYEGETNRNKWVITLSGGGGCLEPQNCANRWCGVGTNFDADNMSTSNGLPGGGLQGILSRRAENPFGNWNHVIIRYCSSDVWSGRGLAVELSAKDPKTGADVKFEINFAGGYILEAGLATLRREGVPALASSAGGRRVELPDLDDATDVLFAGGSAGGSGVSRNLDRVADKLRRGGSRPNVLGFIDAATSPSPAALNYQPSTLCKEKGVCSYQAYWELRTKAILAIHKGWADESCIAWHEKNEPGTEWQCYDDDHVLTHHTSTPYFIRMNLGDTLISSLDIDAGLAGADGRVFTRLTWGQALADTLRKLQANVAGGHERQSVTRPPGVFAPACTRHYTIFDDTATHQDTITVAGNAYTVLDVMKNWMAGQKPDVVIGSDPRQANCPGDK